MDLNPGSLPPESHLNPRQGWVRAQVASAHEIKSLNTSPRWDNKGTRQSPQTTLSLAWVFKSHVLYPRGECLQQPWSGLENFTALDCLLTKNIGAFGTSQLKSGRGKSDGKLSSMKSLFRMSGWWKKPLWPNQLKTKQNNTQIPICEPVVWSSDTHLSGCGFGDTHF